MSGFEVLKHHFIGDDVYLKEMRIDDGFIVKTHKHTFPHVSLLTKGAVIVTANGIQKTHYAPDYLFIEAGIEHSIEAVNSDAKWYCVHITDETDSTKVDEVLIEKVE